MTLIMSNDDAGQLIVLGLQSARAAPKIVGAVHQFPVLVRCELKLPKLMASPYFDALDEFIWLEVKLLRYPSAWDPLDVVPR
jgi:hypothetical protein